MYRLTYIHIGLSGPEIVSVASPNRAGMMTMYDAMRIAGVHVRLWDHNQKLVTPHRVWIEDSTKSTP